MAQLWVRFSIFCNGRDGSQFSFGLDTFSGLFFFAAFLQSSNTIALYFTPGTRMFSQSHGGSVSGLRAAFYASVSSGTFQARMELATAGLELSRAVCYWADFSATAKASAANQEGPEVSYQR
jgi:hypothetical protein